MTENEIRDLFREMRDEEIPPDSLARVRLGVSERTQRRRSFGFWKIAATVATVACLVWVFSTPRRAQPIPARAPAEQVDARLTPPPELPPIRRVVHRRRKPAPPVEPTQIARGAALIRIETPDPEVVILLLGD